jgi:hydrogenase-4 component F
MLHMTYHTIAKSLLFLCAGNIYQYFKSDLFEKVKGGIIRVLPVTGAVFLMATLAVVGMPPFSLFQSEFLVLRATFEAGLYVPTALFVLFGTGIFAGALLRVGGLVLGEGPTGETAGLNPWSDYPMLALAAALVIVGFWLPGPLFQLILGAANVVTGG